MEKKYMLHFFHERNYEPQSLQAVSYTHLTLPTNSRV